MLLPAVETGSGPFQGRTGGFTAEPETEGQLMTALSFYLALMTQTCLGLVGARGPVIIEGPFASNKDYCAMLAALRPEGLHVASSTTGTSAGAALLVQNSATLPGTRKTNTKNQHQLQTYANKWHELVASTGNKVSKRLP
jgi:sugar (pentulose or hexulose) kinase